MKSKQIYCDHNATTPVDDCVQDIYIKSLQNFGNASSLHLYGRQAKEALENARQIFADHIHAEVDQIIFCSSGTEANNHVFQQFIVDKMVYNQPVHFLISAIEHSSIFQTINYLKQFDIEFDVIPVDSKGFVDQDSYIQLFKPYTRLVSIALANNEIGTVQPIDALVSIAHEKGALFHTDAVQALGKMVIDVTLLNCDFISFSAHKVYAPKGVGGLYVCDDTKIKPLLYGGFHEKGLRASTENISGIMAFSEALNQIDIKAYQQHTLELKKALIHRLNTIDGVVFNGPLDMQGLTNTLSVSFEHCNGYALAMNCDLEGIALSTGSACSVGSIEPSHVLQAIGLSEDQNKNTIRISFGKTNQLSDVDFIGDKIHEIVNRLRLC